MSSYNLTADQISFYDRNGYLILRNWITGPLLERLQTAADSWISQGQTAQPSNQHWPDYSFARRPTGQVMFRVDYLHNKGQAASLELLGAPQVLAVAESLCGPNFVPTYESMVFKMAGDGAPIKWHQDAVHASPYRIFNFDLYLDPSTADGGALRVVPKSHLQNQDICALTEEYGWSPPDVVCAEMQPGDVLLHNVMVVHGSPPVTGKALRRTLYYEFRAAEEILQDGPWDRQWIDHRLQLLPLAQNLYQQSYPDQPQYQLPHTADFQAALSNDQSPELRVYHYAHMEGAGCPT